MRLIRHLRNRYFLALDVLLLGVAVLLSYVLRLETLDFERFQSGLVFYTACAILIVPFVFYIFGIYARYWIYASVEEMMILIVSVTIGATICGMIGLVISRVFFDLNLPRSIPFIFWPLALVVTAGPRFSVRLYAQHARRWPGLRQMKAPLTPVLVVGAGHAGTGIIRELHRNPELGMHVIGFIDDDPRKRSARILGVPVLGNRRAIPQLVKDYGIQLVIIAIPAAPGREIRNIITICEQAEVPTKIMPGLYEMLDGTVSVNQLRNVQIEDLLRRDAIHVDAEAVQHLLKDKRVLVTGGGGSIGSELCRQILRCHPAVLIVLGHGENSVFEICNELSLQIQQRFKSGLDRPERLPVMQPVIADIRFPDRLSAILREYRPEIVFHAAAHKHVPLMESNPIEAITNNVLGTRNLLDAAALNGVERFVMISTDKAVNPISLMGASKRVAEMLVRQAAWETGKPYVAVRFGNVLGSRGSVLQMFKQQIAAGGPVTVTHPEMKRYFMTIPEAVQLVLQAAVLGQGGETFMLDMGEPVKIVDLARDVIELSGLEVGRDIEIVFTGIRPGEKLYEDLFAPGQTYQRTAHEKIFVIDSAHEVLPSRLTQVVAQLENATFTDDLTTLFTALDELLPGCRTPAAGQQAKNVPAGTLPIGPSAAQSAVAAELIEVATQRPDDP